MEKNDTSRSVYLKNFSCYPGDTVTDPLMLADYLETLLTRIEQLESIVKRLQNETMTLL